LINDSVSNEVFLGVFDVAKRTTLLHSKNNFASLSREKKKEAFGCQREHPPCVKDGQTREKAERFLLLSPLHTIKTDKKKPSSSALRVLPSSFFPCPALFFCGLISVRSTKTRTIDTNLPTFFAFSKKTREKLSFLQEAGFFSRLSTHKRREESKKTDALTLFSFALQAKKRKKQRAFLQEIRSAKQRL
jgi:hypothetical protein